MSDSIPAFRMHTEVPQQLFESTGHVPIALRRLPEARLLWVNRKAMRDSALYQALVEDADAYDRHLLTSCAFVVIAADDLAAPDAQGFADRYGGGGIGRNGGSGRAAFVNGFHIKGIGRTPLVSTLTPVSHASGGTYLEESVRETIFAQLVGNEFPLGAVPTLAILDTGLIQQWGPGITPSRERRTLVIRPTFLRPAHFERATGFVSDNPKEGVLDTLRVRRMFEAAQDQFGKEWLVEQYTQLWPGWSSQLAYSFVHRLPTGSITTSNIAMDGRLVDFGAMSAVPSWASIATSYYPKGLRMQLDTLKSRLHAAAYFFGLHCDSALASAQSIEAMSQAVERAFRHTLMVESLYFCGVGRSAAMRIAESKAGVQLWTVLHRVIQHFQREYFDMIGSTPAPRMEWDLAKVWHPTPPPHLRELSAMLRDLVPAAGHPQAQELCEVRAATRSHLFYPELRQSILRELDVDGGSADDQGGDDTDPRIAALIERYGSHVA